MVEGFQRGSGAFPCVNCGKLTRKMQNTDNTDLCKKCFDEISEENRISDSGEDD
jgi:hypothetical protein